MKNLRYALVLFILLSAILACGGGGAIAAATEAPAATQAPPQPTETAASPAEPVPATIYDAYYQRKTKEGMAAVEEFLAAHPDNAEALALQAAFYYRLNNYDAALTVVNHAIDLDPNLAFGYAERASILYAQSGDSKADEQKADVEKALQLDPNVALAYEVRGKINYYYDNNADQAKADLEQALKLQREYISPKIVLADILIDQEQYQDAVDMLDQILETYSTAGLLSQRSYAKYQLGDLEGAIADATASIEADGKNSTAYLYRGYAYDEQGEKDKALADYEMAISLGTKNDSAFTSAALIIAYQENGDYQKALEYTNKALELAPGDVYALNAQGDVYWFMGEYEKAVESYTAAIDGGNDYSYMGRGDAYAKLGEKDKAISDYQAFLAAYPDDTNSSDYVKQQLKALGVQ